MTSRLSSISTAMQTLTSPASISKRKQACNNCRHRKKKCDGIHPACTPCQKWGMRCEYASRTAGHEHSGHETRCKLNDSHSLQANLLPFQFETLPDFALDSLAPPLLPPDVKLLEIAQLFLKDLYPIFPYFHKQSLLEQIRDGFLYRSCPILLYAICTITIRRHSDVSMHKYQKDWYEQAKLLYDLTPRHPQPSLRVIQTVPLLIYHAFTVGDFSTSWLFIGKVWQQIVALEMNRLDAKYDGYSNSIGPGTESWSFVAANRTEIEKEECRRTLWVLFMMDRNHAWPTGWPNTMSEPQLKINLPAPDEEFQSLRDDAAAKQEASIPFTRDLDQLIASTTGTKKSVNMLLHLSVAHVLLGRISELVYSLHSEENPVEYAKECDYLASRLQTFRANLPREAKAILHVAPTNRSQCICLNAIVNTSTILLHYHRPKTSARAPNFELAVAAARSTGHTIQIAAAVSMESLMSAHIASSLYVAAATLIISQKIQHQISSQEYVNLTLAVFNRMNEVFIFLGWKFKLALEHDLKRDVEDVKDLKKRGLKGLLTDCTKWSHVRREAERRGLDVEIT